MNKRNKHNIYKSNTDESAIFNSDSGGGIDICIKCIITVAFVSILSLAFIFAYDFITQSEFFNIKKIEFSGTNHVLKEDILQLANLTGDENIFGLNLFTIEKRIVSHPWIRSVCVKRNFDFVLFISVIEQKPLAIVKIGNLAEILINTQGRPFKEHNPLKDHLKDLPVITGLDLASSNNQFMFSGTLFNAIMDFLSIEGSSSVKRIKGDRNTGIAIKTNDIYNQLSPENCGTIQIRLGFNNFKAKLKKAKKISEYIDKNFPERTICTMDLFNIEKIFIKTKLADTLHNNIEKGV